MSGIVFPDVTDLEGVVADYYDALRERADVTIDRGEVVSGCVEPFALLIKAWQPVDARGGVAEQIFMTFIRDLLLSKVRLEASSNATGELLH